MNRIERLIWEETQLKEIERQQRKSPGMTGAKLILIALLAGLIALLVGLIALLASRVSMPPPDDAVVRALLPTSVFYTPFAAPNPASDVGPSPAASSASSVAMNADQISLSCQIPCMSANASLVLQPWPSTRNSDTKAVTPMLAAQ